MSQVEFFAPPLLTLSASLFAISSDTVEATAASVVEQGASKGHYIATFAAASSGTHLLVAYALGIAVAAHYVYLTDSATVHRAGNYADVVCAEQVDLLHSFERNKLVTNPVSGELVIYEADGTTPLLRAELFEDVAETQRYRGRGVEVRRKVE